MDNNVNLLPPVTSDTNCEVAVLDQLLNMLPPGYKFRPDDVDLIEYLKDKIAGVFIFPGLIHEVDIYIYSPQELNDKYKREGEQYTYFFTPRNRKYPNGSRPDRAAGGVGFWKATGKDNPIKNNNTIIGFKKTLVFYNGKPKQALKTNWIMQEFTRNNTKNLASSSTIPPWKLDGWVLCKVYKNKRERDDQDAREMSEHNSEATKEVTNSMNKVATLQYMPNQHSQDGQHLQSLVSSSVFESSMDPNLFLSQDGQHLQTLMSSSPIFESSMDPNLFLSQDGQHLQTLISPSPIFESSTDLHSFLPPTSSLVPHFDDEFDIDKFDICDLIDFSK